MRPSFQNRGRLEPFQVPSISCALAALPEGCAMCVRLVRMSHILKGISNGTSHLWWGRLSPVNDNSRKCLGETAGTDPAFCSVLVIPPNISLFCSTEVKAAFTTSYYTVTSVPVWGRGRNNNLQLRFEKWIDLTATLGAGVFNLCLSHTLETVTEWKDNNICFAKLSFKKILKVRVPDHSIICPDS